MRIRGRKTEKAVTGIAERMLQRRRYQSFQSKIASRMSSRVRPLSSVTVLLDDGAGLDWASESSWRRPWVSSDSDAS